MDEETRAQFAAVIARMNDGFERILVRLGAVDERLSALVSGFQKTKGFLIEDALVLGRRWSALERRVRRIEEGNGSP